jgi:DNA-binding IclR family transcriptional regulator
MAPTIDVTDRERFMTELRALTGEDPGRSAPLGEIARRLDLHPDQAQLIADSLVAGMPGSAAHGLIELDGEGSVRFTPEGLEFLETLDGTVATE